jgi:hypothetical protein
LRERHRRERDRGERRRDLRRRRQRRHFHHGRHRALGGTITTSGTVAVANKGITAALIADNTIGLGQINTSQVQARITGTCAVGRYFRGVAADGTVLCEQLPA